LTGSIAPGVDLLHGSCSTGYTFFKRREMSFISHDVDDDIIHENDAARMWCKNNVLEGCGVSLVREAGCGVPFIVLYREKTSSHPHIVTVEGMLRNPESRSRLSSLDVYHLLQRHCKSRNTFLQMNGLKLWDGGRLWKRLRLESAFDT